MIFEYNKEKEMRLIRQDEREIGRQEGIKTGAYQKLSEQVRKKLLKDQSVEQIAEALEENVEVIRKILEKMQ